jgi:uncharacterized protein with PIN domain
MMNTREGSLTERQCSLDSAFSSISSASSDTAMATSFPSYGFITAAEVFTTSPKFCPTQYQSIVHTRASGAHHLHTSLLTHLDPHNTGYVSPQCLVEYWQDLGIGDGNTVIEDLGLNVEEERIDLRILSEKLNDEIWQGVEVVSYASAQAAITLYDEVLIVKNTLENVAKERDMFRCDVQEAKKRSAMLAIEIDEHHEQNDNKRKIELKDLNKQWNLRLQIVEEEFNKEKQTHEETLERLKRTFDQEKENFEEILRRMANTVCTINKRNKKLEEEIESTLKRLMEVNDAKLMSYKSKTQIVHDLLEEDICPDLIRNVEDLVRVNKDLKDRNEVLEMDCLVNSFNTCTHNSPHSMKRKGCHLQDSPSSSSKNKVIKKTNGGEFQTYTSDESEPDEDEAISLSDIWCNFDQEYKEPVCNTADSSNSIQDQFIRTGSDTNTEETQLIGEYMRKIFDLEERNQELQITIRNLSCTNTDKTCQDREGTDTKNVKYSTSSDSPKSEDIQSDNYGQNMTDKEKEIKKENKTVSEDLANQETESHKLLETNKHLEESLELMHSEFESMEDYWQKKMDDERIFYEGQLKASEKQFRELELKLEEYEELLNSRVDGSEGLFTIDEQRSMEETVNEWEDEIAQLKLQIEDMKGDHEKEVNALTEQLGKVERSKPDMFSCTRCAEFASLKEKRRKLEDSWLRVVHRERRLSVGPVSLPAEYPVEECRLRQDVRRSIEEDYDTMLQRKERLKLDMTGVSNVATQAPQVLDMKAHTPTTTYKAILSDISSQISILHSELSSASSTDKMLLKGLRSRICGQENRCHNLYSTLALRRGKYCKDMEVTKDHQTSELSQLESLVSSSQDLLRRQTRLYMERMSKQVIMDTDIEQLMAENQKLASEINLMKRNF